MNTQSHIIRLRQWARLVTEAENSGNKAAWCRERNIPYKMYGYWQKRVRAYILEHGEGSLDTDDISLPAISSGTVDLFDVTSRIQSAPSCAVSHSDQDSAMQPELMLRYGDFHIYVGNAVTERTLTTVLKAVRNA